MPTLTATPDITPAISPPVRNWRHRFGRAAFLLCGLLLHAAAVFKLVGTNVAPFAQYGWLLTPTVQAAAVLWEVLLGAWLLFGLVEPAARRCAPLPWLLAVLTFAAFAVVSGYLGLIGQASCGCFGVIKASPWAAFTLDVIALTLLALGRPRWTGWSSEVGAFGRATAVGAVVLTGILIPVLIYGSPDAVVARLRGDPLGVSPRMLDFGNGQPGETRAASLTVRNYTGEPLRVIGGTSDCSCTVLEDLPASIPPHGSVQIEVRLTVPNATPGEFVRSARLFTDTRSQPELGFVLRCRVTPSDSP